MFLLKLIKFLVAIICKIGDAFHERSPELEKRIVRKIVVYSPFGIGDVLMVSPILLALREAFPKAKMSVVGSKVSLEVLKNNPYSDSLIALPDGFFAKIYLFRQLKSDLVISDYSGSSFRAAVYALLTSAPYRISYTYPTALGRSGFLLTKTMSPGRKHYVDLNADLLKLLGIEIPQKERVPKLYITSKDMTIASEFFAKNNFIGQRVLGVHIGSTKDWKGKRWAIENFAEVINSVATSSIRIIIFCGPDEIEDVSLLLDFLNSAPVVAKDFTLIQIGAIMKKCDVLLSNDSALMHIAAGVGTKSVGIYGFTDPSVSGAYGVKHEAVVSSAPCSPCYTLDKPFSCDKDYKCIKQISVEAVLSAVWKLLNDKERK